MKHLVHNLKNRKPLHPSTFLLEIPRVLIRLEIYPKSSQLRNVLDITIIWRPHIVAFIFTSVFDLFNSIYHVWQRIRKIIFLKRFYSVVNATFYTLFFNGLWVYTNKHTFVSILTNNMLWCYILRLWLCPLGNSVSLECIHKLQEKTYRKL